MSYIKNSFLFTVQQYLFFYVLFFGVMLSNFIYKRCIRLILKKREKRKKERKEMHQVQIILQVFTAFYFLHWSFVGDRHLVCNKLKFLNAWMTFSLLMSIFSMRGLFKSYEIFNRWLNRWHSSKSILAWRHEDLILSWIHCVLTLIDNTTLPWIFESQGLEYMWEGP